MHKYTYTNMYIIKKIISSRFISCWDLTSLLKPYKKKEEIWLSPMTKASTQAEMSKGQSDNTNNATKKLDYTAVAEKS